jgi:PAS domain S-box-containing protein
MKPEEILFRSIVESTSDVLLVLDDHGQIRYAGRASLSATGYTPEELEKQSLPMLIHPSDAPRISAVFRVARDTHEQTAPIECRLRRKDGSWRVFDVGVDALISAMMPRHVLVSCRDVTARSRAARQLRLARSLLRSQNEAGQDAILVLSGEGDVLQCNERFLQLWRIDAKSVLLRCDADVWPRVLVELEEPKVFLRAIATISADRERVQTSQIRTRAGAVIECYSAPIEPFAQDEGGRLWRFRDVTAQQQPQGVACPRKLDLGTLVRDSLPVLRAAAEPAADVRIAIDTKTPPIHADALAVQRVLIHLVLHASRAIRGPKGVIEIGVVAVEVHDRMLVRLTVADNGVGMSIEEGERVFQRSPGASRPHSTGSGLATVRETVESQGGQVTVESRPGAGSTFRVDFPLSDDADRCCDTESCARCGGATP